MDISKTIEAKSDQLNAQDLLGGEKTVTITDVKLVSGDQPLSISYEGDNGKPFKPCKSMRRVLMKAWGTDGKEFIGKSMTLFCDESVKWAGQAVGGIRISDMSDIKADFTVVLAENRQSRKPYKVKKLVVETVDVKALEVAGMDASSRGMESYTAWGKSLSPKEKAAVKSKLGKWTEDAKEVDNKSEKED